MKFTLKVEGMTCGHCTKAVTAAIHRLDGNARVEVDLASGTVHVEGSISPDLATRAIQDAGYAISGTVEADPGPSTGSQ